MLVFFGAPREQRAHARRAVVCALDIDRYCEEFRVLQARENIEFGVTRIGVHSGTAVVGNVGGSRRFEYTAYGDCINTASRLESLNQHLGTRVCISGDSIVEHPQEMFHPVGKVLLKGKTVVLDVFTIWDKLKESEQGPCLAVFGKMRQQDLSADEELVKLLALLPNHALTAFQLTQVRMGKSPVKISMKEK
jgi:adenylate cyclase